MKKRKVAGILSILSFPIVLLLYAIANFLAALMMGGSYAAVSSSDSVSISILVFKIFKLVIGFLGLLSLAGIPFGIYLLVTKSKKDIAMIQQKEQ